MVFDVNFILEQITCKAMCKMLISVESGYELEVLQKEVAHVCEAMLAFPLRLPRTRFYKGLQVKYYIQLRVLILPPLAEPLRGQNGPSPILLFFFLLVL